MWFSGLSVPVLVCHISVSTVADLCLLIRHVCPAARATDPLHDLHTGVRDPLSDADADIHIDWKRNPLACALH